MLKTVALASAPLVTVWTATLAFAWCTSPERRGTVARRGRDLRAPAPDPKNSSGLIDLSRRAAAYALGIRIGSLVRGTSYLLLVTCALFHSNQILSLIGLAAAIWIGNRWQKVANLAFLAAAGDISLAFNHATWAYHFPQHKRGLIYNLFYNGPGMALSIFGIAFIGFSGLPFAYHSDTLATGIPGLSVQHSQLPLWLISTIFFVTGAVIALIGAWVERRTLRRAMRRETRIVPRLLDKRPAAVFLRPFESELLTVPSHPGPRRDGLSLLLPKPREFLENAVTWLLWANGDVVAVAAPNAGQAKTVGAAHHPLRPGADWQAAVRKLLKRTRAIVLVPGASSGVAWEMRTVLDNPDFAGKALIVNPEPRHDPRAFLATVGAPAPLADELGQRRLRALAAVSTPAGPRLLCSSLAEDIDFEVAVEWFVRHQLPRDTSFWSKAQRLAVALGLDSS